MGPGLWIRLAIVSGGGVRLHVHVRTTRCRRVTKDTRPSDQRVSHLFRPFRRQIIFDNELQVRMQTMSEAQISVHKYLF